MIRNYIKLSLKVLGRHKLFTFISLFGISFTLLILVIIASFFNHALGPGAPERNLDRSLSVVMLILKSDEGGMAGGPALSRWFLHNTVPRMQTPEKISIASMHKRMITYHGKRKHKLDQKYVDGPFWEIMDFEFVEGRPFSQAEVERVGDPLYGDIRRLTALTGSDIALIPVELRFTAEGAFRLTSAILNPTTGRVLWFGVVEGGAGGVEEPGTLASVADALARTLLPLG